MSKIAESILSSQISNINRMQRGQQAHSQQNFSFSSVASNPSFTPVSGFAMGQSLRAARLANTVRFTGADLAIEKFFTKKNYGPRYSLTGIVKELTKNVDFLKNGSIEQKIEVGNKKTQQLLLEIKKGLIEGKEGFITTIKKEKEGKAVAEFSISKEHLDKMPDDIGIMAFNDKKGNILMSMANDKRIVVAMPGTDVANATKDVKVHVAGEKPASFTPASNNIEDIKKLDLSKIKAFSARDKKYEGPMINIVVKDGNAAEAHIATIRDFLANPEKAKLATQIIESRKTGEVISAKEQEKAAKLLNDSQIEILSGGLGSRSGADERTLKAGKYTATSKALTPQPNGLSPIENVLVNLMASGVDLSGAKLGENIRISVEQNKPGENLRSISSAYFNGFMDAHKPNIILPNDGQVAVKKRGFSNVFVNALDKMKEDNLAGVIVLKEQTLDQVASKLGVVDFDEGTGIVKNLGEKLSKEELELPENQSFKLENGNYVTSIFNTVMGEEMKAATDELVPFINKDGKADLNGRIVGPLCAISTHETPAEMKKANALLKDVPDEKLMHIKNDVLKGKKIGCVSMDEDWGDLGDIFDNYEMQHEIAQGKFNLSPFENQKTLEALNPKTGVIAQNPDLLKAFEEEFPDADGRIMVFNPTEEPAKEITAETDKVFAESMEKTKKNLNSYEKYDSYKEAASAKSKEEPKAASTEKKEEAKADDKPKEGEEPKKGGAGKWVAGGVGVAALGGGGYLLYKNHQAKKEAAK